MVAPGNNTNIYLVNPKLVTERERRTVPVPSWVITNAETLGAGFYFGRQGSPFPFRVVRAPDEQVRSYNFEASFQLK
jgi:hypothetical protein